MRKELFDEDKFNWIKQQIKKVSNELYVEIESLTFKDIEKDEIFYDRFFFLYMWYSHYKQNINN